MVKPLPPVLGSTLSHLIRNEADAVKLRFRVFIGRPVTRSIPLFAMPAEKSRDEVEQVAISSAQGVRGAVGQKAASALLRGRYGNFAVIQCRTRFGRTATYSPCVAFAVAHDAETFSLDYPELSFGAKC